MACQQPDGIKILPDGKHELSPCKFVEAGVLRNVTIQLLRCENCGEYSIAWWRQPNTEAFDGISDYEEHMLNFGEEAHEDGNS